MTNRNPSNTPENADLCALTAVGLFACRFAIPHGDILSPVADWLMYQAIYWEWVR